ncbi:ABC transporter substrate-binding protein [Clostridia bacterium]|nr:ABC transporter substrate-binding protein [Clostridia bacterium]
MKKLISLALALAMLLALGMTTAYAAPYNLDYYWIGNGDTADRIDVQNAINEYVEPLLDVNVTFHIIGWGDWLTKAITTLNAGEKADIFFTADWEYYMRSVKQDQFMPLNDDNGPYGNLLAEYGKDILATINPAFLYGSQVDGINYAVPTQKELCVPNGWVYNIDAAEEVGFDISSFEQPLTDYSVLEPYLAAYKALHPDVYPYIIDGQRGENPWVPNFADGLDAYISMKWNPEADGTFDETIYSVWETESNLEYSRILYKWAQLGYINPDSLLTSYSVVDEMSAGKFLICPQPLKGSNIKAVELMNSSGNPGLRLGEFYGNQKVAQTQDTGGSMLAIPYTSENPEAAMKYINLMHSDSKLVNMMLFGVEGKNWQFAEDGRVEILDANWAGAHAGAWTVGNTALQAVTVDEDPEKNQLLASYADDAIPHISMGFRFDQTPVNDEIIALFAISESYDRALKVGAADPDVTIPEFMSLAKAAGLEKVFAEVQSQYDAWKAAKAANQ